MRKQRRKVRGCFKRMLNQRETSGLYSFIAIEANQLRLYSPRSREIPVDRISSHVEMQKTLQKHRIQRTFYQVLTFQESSTSKVITIFVACFVLIELSTPLHLKDGVLISKNKLNSRKNRFLPLIQITSHDQCLHLSKKFTRNKRSGCFFFREKKANSHAIPSNLMIFMSRVLSASAHDVTAK